jgi:hypothetical protein
MKPTIDWLIDVSRDSVEDYLEGLHTSIRSQGKLTPTAAEKARDSALKLLQEQIQSVSSFDEAFERLSATDQQKLLAMLRQIAADKDTNEEFAVYRKRLNTIRSLRVLVQHASTGNEMLDYLRQTRGQVEKPPPPARPKGIEGFIQNLLDGLAKAGNGLLHRLTDPVTPDEQDGMDEEKKAIKASIKEIDDDIKKLTW